MVFTQKSRLAPKCIVQDAVGKLYEDDFLAVKKSKSQIKSNFKSSEKATCKRNTQMLNVKSEISFIIEKVQLINQGFDLF